MASLMASAVMASAMFMGLTPKTDQAYRYTIQYRCSCESVDRSERIQQQIGQHFGRCYPCSLDDSLSELRWEEIGFRLASFLTPILLPS